MADEIMTNENTTPATSAPAPAPVPEARESEKRAFAPRGRGGQRGGPGGVLPLRLPRPLPPRGRQRLVLLGLRLAVEGRPESSSE